MWTGGQWPSPLPVDPITYQREHEAWLARERANLSKVLPVTGIWPLGDGETAFGADPALPIPLPAAHAPPRAGAFRQVGGTVTVTPAADFVLRREDGSRLDSETRVRRVLTGPFLLDVTDVGDDRRWVTATDTTQRAMTAPPPLPARRAVARQGYGDDGGATYLANVFHFNDQAEMAKAMWPGLDITPKADGEATHQVYLDVVQGLILPKGVWPAIGTRAQGVGVATKTNVAGFYPWFDE